jgi:hypothetical protein
MNKFKTLLVSKANIVKPNSESFKAVASSIKDRYGFELKPQMDLLYLQSCLVSAGATIGVNDNDDIFTREEAWAARHTPVLKPFNWQHNDKDILGVIYTVQAKDINGNILNINDDNVPDVDFDLWTEAVIFKLIHADRAREIEKRSRANNLFVSMEAWFDDYNYGLCNEQGLTKILARNQDTGFLDKHLRAAGGNGKYLDPDLGQEVRIGRVLRSITFGGCGLVDSPANKRSHISSVEPIMNFTAHDDVESLLLKVFESDSNMLQEELLMNAQANNQGPIKPEEIKTVIASVLDERDQVAAKARDEATLKARASQAEAKSQELEAKVAELNQALQSKDAENKSLNDQTAAYQEAVRKLIDEHVAAAGATDDTPPEIAAIDAAKTGEEAFKAKIAWIQNSLAGLRARAARADELELSLAEAETIVRENEVRALLDGVVSDEVMETFVSHAASLDNEEYSRWRDEKELMVIEMVKAAKKAKEGSPEEEADESAEEAAAEGDEPKGKMAKKKAKSNATNPFKEWLEKLRSEAGEADPNTMDGANNHEELINPPDGGGIESGVSPEKLRTPRHKIAGSAAGNDPLKALKNAKPKSDVSLAGASQAGDEGATVNPFRVLAELVTEQPKQVSEETDTKAKKPGFDPVQN